MRIKHMALFVVLFDQFFLVAGCSSLATQDDIRFETRRSTKAPLGYEVMCANYTSPICDTKDKKSPPQYYCDEKCVQKSVLDISTDVNRRFVYIDDQEQYGVSDYWKPTPYSYKGVIRGDCDDFTLAVAEQALGRGVMKKIFISYLYI